METTGMDDQTRKAWQGWVFFTQATTVGVIACAGVLGLMALFLL